MKRTVIGIVVCCLLIVCVGLCATRRGSHFPDLTDYLTKQWLKDTAQYGATYSLVYPNMEKHARGWMAMAERFRYVHVGKTQDTNDYTLTFSDGDGNSATIWLQGNKLESIDFCPQQWFGKKPVNWETACDLFFGDKTDAATKASNYPGPLPDAMCTGIYSNGEWSLSENGGAWEFHPNKEETKP